MKDFDRWLDKIYNELESEVEEAIKEASNETFNGAVERVPYDTGHLERSIQKQPLKKENGIIESVVTVGAKYGIFVEYGTYKMPGRFFMSKSFNEALQELERELQRISKK